MTGIRHTRIVIGVISLIVYAIVICITAGRFQRVDHTIIVAVDGRIDVGTDFNTIIDTVAVTVYAGNQIRRRSQYPDNGIRSVGEPRNARVGYFDGDAIEARVKAHRIDRIVTVARIG